MNARDDEDERATRDGVPMRTRVERADGSERNERRGWKRETRRGR